MKHRRTVHHHASMRRGATALLVTALLALSACGGSEDAADNGRLAFSHPNSSAPVTKAVQKYAEDRATELGYELVVDDPKQQVAVQVTSIETWTTQRVKGITMFSSDVSATAAARDKAKAEGIKWATYGSGNEDGDGAVKFSHAQSGELLGQDAVAWIKAQDEPQKVLLLTATTAPVLSDRWTVPADMIESQTSAEIVVSQDAITQETGLRVAETALAAHPDLRVVIAMNDDAALGATKAFSDRGIDPESVYIGGQDGSLEALEAVKKGGYYKATVSVNIPAVGKAVVDALVQQIDGEGDGVIEVQPILGTRDDAEGLDELIGHYG